MNLEDNKFEICLQNRVYLPVDSRVTRATRFTYIVESITLHTAISAYTDILQELNEDCFFVEPGELFTIRVRKPEPGRFIELFNILL